MQPKNLMEEINLRKWNKCDFNMPKHHCRKHRKLHDRLFVAAEKDNTTFHFQLVKNYALRAWNYDKWVSFLEKYVESDEHESYFWLGKATNHHTHLLCMPALWAHYKACHNDDFKVIDGTYANKIEVFNSLMKIHENQWKTCLST